jgi:hypothetical protein
MNAFMTLAAGIALATVAPTVAGAAQNDIHPDAAVKVAGGVIAANGTINGGKGFTSVHNATGEYTLTWPSGYFKTCPVVNVTPAGLDGDIPISDIYSYGCTNGGVQVLVVISARSTGAGLDNAFHIVLNSI